MRATLYSKMQRPKSCGESGNRAEISGYKEALQKGGGPFILIIVTTVKEIEAAIPRLSRAEVEELRAWIDDFLEDQLELTDEVKAKLDQSRQEIAAGNYTTRQSK
jgi:succinylarginine dihydrolase